MRISALHGYPVPKASLRLEFRISFRTTRGLFGSGHGSFVDVIVGSNAVVVCILGKGPNIFGVVSADVHVDVTSLIQGAENLPPPLAWSSGETAACFVGDEN